MKDGTSGRTMRQLVHVAAAAAGAQSTNWRIAVKWWGVKWWGGKWWGGKWWDGKWCGRKWCSGKWWGGKWWWRMLRA
ncbi:MAG: hypothetical protein ABI238_02335, partial [Terrimesophilobacter sp.]